MFSNKIKLSFTQVIAGGYALIILAGALLLMLPVASRSHETIPFIDALFTATSALCVTGLVVYDTFTQFTLFGQVVILSLIQIGGLGFMSVAVLVSLALGKKIGLRERGLLMESINTFQLGGVVRLFRRVLLITLALESAGALVLAVRFIPDFGLADGLYYGVFHAISALCNAGFDLMGRVAPYSSLVSYSKDIAVNLALMGLIIAGGLGFVVWDDLTENSFHVSRYKLHTKIVLFVSLLLIFVPAGLFWLLENDNTLLGLNAGEKLLASLFSVITPRTAGFNTVDTAALTEGGSMLTMLLMFVGAGSGSTAGGIKVTTAAVIFLGVVSYIRNREDLSIWGRRLEGNIFWRAGSIAALYLFLTVTGGFALLFLQDFSIKDAMFESLSAIGTVGLTTGVTRELCRASRLIILTLMYCGRVGGVSVAMAVAPRIRHSNIKKPEERINVG
jgi:trk system potassium uptake protein TrkH